MGCPVSSRAAETPAASLSRSEVRCGHECSSRADTWPQALQFLGLEGQSKWAFIAYESLFFCFFFVCAWAAVHFIRWDKR